MSTLDDINAARKALPDLAAGVVRALGDGWRYATDPRVDWYASIAGPDGECLMLGVDTRRPATHVTVTVSMPDQVRDSGAYTRDLETDYINVAKARGPAVIAKEIVRRLLPACRERLAVGRRRAEESIKGRAQRDRAVAIVAELLGVEVPKPHRNANPDDPVYVHAPRARVDVRKGGHVVFEVGGDVDDLRGVLAELGKVPACGTRARVSEPAPAPAGVGSSAWREFCALVS